MYTPVPHLPDVYTVQVVTALQATAVTLYKPNHQHPNIELALAVQASHQILENKSLIML